eukprot:gene1520-1762_t
MTNAANIFFIYAISAFILGSWPLISIRDFNHSGSQQARSADSPSHIHPEKVDVEASRGQGEPCDTSSDARESDREKSSSKVSGKKSATDKQPDSDIDELSFPLTMDELIRSPQVINIIVLQIAMLTPGWGIKLASISILLNLFGVSNAYAAAVSSAYVSCYAIGRFFAGTAAESLGARRTYIPLLLVMAFLLVSLSIPLRLMPHDSSTSPGCTLFSIIICLIGLLYGGAQALVYSLVFDIFGALNYKKSFSCIGSGFSGAVIVGGLSSAYSFSRTGDAVAARDLAESWFYAMAG